MALMREADRARFAMAMHRLSVLFGNRGEEFYDEMWRGLQKFTIEGVEAAVQSMIERRPGSHGWPLPGDIRLAMREIQPNVPALPEGTAKLMPKKTTRLFLSALLDRIAGKITPEAFKKRIEEIRGTS